MFNIYSNFNYNEKKIINSEDDFFFEFDKQHF